MTIHLPRPQERPALLVGQQGYDPQIAQVLETMLHGAVTIAQLVQVSEHVVDAAIVYATTAAAELFGYAHPVELIGQYISTVHHPDDALVTRQYALARLHHEWFPDPYPMRILRAPTQEPVPVIKHVQQVMIDGIMTWITLHTPFDYSHKFVMPVTSAMLDRAGSVSEQQFLGLAHVAYMDRVVQAQGQQSLRTFARMVESSKEYLTLTLKEGRVREKLPLKRGKTQGILANILEVLLTAHKKRQRNICVKCGWPWYSRIGVKRPNKCPNCGDKYWDRPYLFGHHAEKAPEEA